MGKMRRTPGLSKSEDQFVSRAEEAPKPTQPTQPPKAEAEYPWQDPALEDQIVRYSLDLPADLKEKIRYLAKKDSCTMRYFIVKTLESGIVRRINKAERGKLP